MISQKLMLLKRLPGRPKGIYKPIKYFTEQGRKEAIKESKTKCTVNKEWYCDICYNGKTIH